MVPVIKVRRKRGKRERGRRGKLNREREKKMLQMIASVLIFAAAMLGRKIFPDQTSAWKEIIFRDVNLKQSFFAFEEAVRKEEPFLDTLTELCIDVFGGE